MSLAYKILNNPRGLVTQKGVPDLEKSLVHKFRKTLISELAVAQKIRFEEAPNINPKIGRYFEMNRPDYKIDNMLRDSVIQPICRPPFKNTWIESSIVFEGETKRRRFGTSWEEIPIEDVSPNSPQWIAKKQALRSIGKPALPVKTLVFGTACADLAEDCYVITGISAFLLDENNELIRHENGTPAWEIVPFEDPGVEWKGTPSFPLSICALCLSGGIMAFGFFNCANVVQEDTGDIRESTPKRERRVRVPQMRYVTLKVQHKGRRMFLDGRESEEELPLPQHAVRGYVKRYGVDGRKPFRGIEGDNRIVWCPPHVRGNAERGKVVHTEYEIQP